MPGHVEKLLHYVVHWFSFFFFFLIIHFYLFIVNFCFLETESFLKRIPPWKPTIAKIQTGAAVPGAEVGGHMDRL